MSGDSVPAVTDWNPLDPDAANVFYDLSSWTSDQQAELTALLANADIAHAWVESELVVAEEHEDVVDRLFDRLEKEFGIGATAVAGARPSPARRRRGTWRGVPSTA